MTRPRGFGLVASRLWEIEGGDAETIARRARAMGLGWVLIELTREGRELVPPAARPALSRITDRLQARGIAVFGAASPARSREPDADDARPGAELARDYSVDGWFQPLRVHPPQTGGHRSVSQRSRVMTRASRQIEPGPERTAFVASPEPLLLWVPSPGAVGLCLVDASLHDLAVPILDLACQANRRLPSAARESRLGEFLGLASEAGWESHGLADWNLLDPVELALLFRPRRATELATGSEPRQPATGLRRPGEAPLPPVEV